MAKGYKLTWRGATVLKEIDNNVDQAMSRLQEDIRQYLLSHLHVYNDVMRPNSFADIEVEQGKKRRLVVGSTAPHAIYHELRYHPQFRETLDIFAPKVTQYLQAALRR